MKPLPYTKFTLPNGLTVLLYPMESVRTAFALLYVRTGAIYENRRDLGLSHFTEHSVFLGTQKYPSALDLSKTASNLGARFDGCCGKFSTQFWVTIPFNNLKAGLDLLYQLSFQPLLQKQDIDRERDVILSEYNDWWHNPDRQFDYHSWQKRFAMKDHPYNHRTLGTPQTIQRINQTQVSTWIQDYYHPANMILSLAGNFDEKAIRKAIEDQFQIAKKGIKAKEPPLACKTYSDFQLYYQELDRPQIRFTLSFPSFGWRQFPRRKNLCLGLLNNIFGGGPASRLFERLREKERFVYRIGSDFLLYPWMGDFQISGSVPVEKLVPAMKAIREEIDRLVQKGVTQEELKISKNFLSASTLMRFDHPESIANYFAAQEFDEEEIWLPEQFIEVGEKITKAEIDELAREIFQIPKVNLSFLGKIKPKVLKEIEGIFN